MRQNANVCARTPNDPPTLIRLPRRPGLRPDAIETQPQPPRGRQSGSGFETTCMTESGRRPCVSIARQGAHNMLYIVLATMGMLIVGLVVWLLLKRQEADSD